MAIQLYTIGFTRKTAEEFFGLLQTNGVQVVVDVRLKRDSQLSGFAKGRDLPYFLKNLIDCDYCQNESMAPTPELLKRYRQDKSWAQYEADFNRLLYDRQLIVQLDRGWWAKNATCLLCSEHEPDHCHRRLIAEYMMAHWPEVEIHHLM